MNADFQADAARVSRRLLAFGVLAALAWLLVTRASVGDSMASYLAAWTLLPGFALGSVALVLIHRLTGGSWGEDLAPWIRAQAHTLPLAGVLAIPLLFSVRELYPWVASAATQDGSASSNGYLNVWFFNSREIILFLLWIFLLRAGFIDRNGRTAQNTASGSVLRMQAKAALGLILYLMTVTIFSIDWIMSLTAHWVSTVFGMLQAVSQVTCALALAVAGTARLRRSAAPERAAVMHDEGNLLLVLVMLWAYLAFMQYIIMWIEDLPRDISWYVPRVLTSWRGLSVFVALLHFAVPLAILLKRRCKRDPRVLSFVCLILLAACLADSIWLVLPSLRPQGVSFGVGDLFVVLALLAFWGAALFRNLSGARPAAFTGTPIARAPLAS